ncbi:MAG TPA: hypothetical protein VLB45_06985 [Nitrosopumilaceae archaeon]|nr:hypothetical protein [Nitrosopumilaceae archaeon]
MSNSINFLAIVFSIFLIASTQNYSASAESDTIKFYGMGKVDQSSQFSGEIVRTIIDGDKGTIIHSTDNGLVVVRLELSESEACILKLSTICFDAKVTKVRGTDIQVGDEINLTIDLENKKEFLSVVSGQFQGENIVIDLVKTRTRDNGEFTLMFTREGGIAGMQRKITIDSETKTMLIQNGPDEPSPLVLSDDDITQIRDTIQRNGFFDFNIKKYPPVVGSADYFTYDMEVTAAHFTNKIQWTDTSENVPKKLYLINEKLQNIILSFIDEHPLEILPLNIAREFVISSPTFAFDGMEETLQVQLSSVTDEATPEYEIHANFDSRHGGYGDRTGQMVTEAITPHLMVITISDGKVVSAIIDGTWDEINQKLL